MPFWLKVLFALGCHFCAFGCCAVAAADGTMAWVMFCACAGLEMIAGQVYGFGLFSDVLRMKPGLALSQGAVEFVAVSENLGQYCRLLGGVFYDFAGTRWTIILGIAMNSVGYLGLWSAVRAASEGNEIAPLQVLCVNAIVYGQGAGWIEVGVVSKVMAVFAGNRCEASGLIKTFFGVASAFGALTFAAFFAPSRESFLLALGFLPVAIGLPLLLFVGGEAPKAGHPGHGLAHPWRHAYGVTLVFVAVLSIHATMAGVTDRLRPYEEHREANLGFFLMACGLLVCLALLQPEQQQPASASVDCSEEDRQGSASAHVVGLLGDLGFVECMTSLRFWALFFSLAAGQGAGLLVLNNMGQLVEALDGGSAELQPICVSIFSVSNAIGRLAMGQAASSGVLTKPRLLACVLAASCVAHVVFSLHGGRRALLAAMPPLGFMYGCYWPLLPVLVSELFGLRAFGAKYAWLTFAAVTGSFPLSYLVVPHFYEAHADESGWCVGIGCFQGSLWCAAAICGLGAVLAVLLDMSLAATRRFENVEAVPGEATAATSISSQTTPGHGTVPGGTARARRHADPLESA